ncbi:uncharacterized protein [Henckelia pumila]|uniref:uncharacterized protein n=1 Tax=Henckelia pumila TaxID=405737 RepID=UPI003C6DDC47
MASYEALYGRRCRTPLHWDKLGERAVLGPEIVTQTIDMIAKIRDRMLTAQSRQKSYADQRCRDLEFEVGLFEILEKVGARAYRVALPPNLESVKNVFHISMLRKYVANPSHVIHHEPVEWTPDLSYEEMPVQILDIQVRRLRNREILMVKILWCNQLVEEATWETKQDIRARYPQLFVLKFFMSGIDSFQKKIFLGEGESFKVEKIRKGGFLRCLCITALEIAQLA